MSYTAVNANGEVDLTANLTGGQIQEVLDSVIAGSIAPIVLHSDIFDSQVVHLLALVTRNRKRKVSSLSREDLIQLLCNYLSSRDREHKLSLLRSARLERTFFYGFVVNFLKEVQGYETLYLEMKQEKDKLKRLEHKRRLAATENSVGFSREKLFPSIRMCADYLSLMYEFRNRIVSNYIRHAYNYAAGKCSASAGRQIDHKDLHQDMLAAVIKSLDKYDASKGALTSYVDFWLLNATNAGQDHGHEYGIAYSIPHNQRKAIAEGESAAVNFAVSLEQQLVNEDGEEGSSLLTQIEGDVGADVVLEQQQQLDIIRRLAKAADPIGLARLYLDIEDIMSNEELELMKKLTLPA